MRLKIFSLVVALVLLPACARKARRTPASSAETAQTASNLAANPDQKRLWKEAAEKNTAGGIENVPLAEQPVQDRQRAAAANRAAQNGSASFPQGLVTGVRVVAAPTDADRDEGKISSEVQVLRAEGEQLVLDLGNNRTLTLQARVRGGQMRARAGERAQLDYRFRNDAFNRQLILGLRLEGGDAVVSILEGGQKPVTVEIPIFKLVATQVGASEKGVMNVEVTVGGSHKVLSQGQVAEFPESGLVVGLLASTAYTGADAYRAEGNPYAIDLVAWSSR
jgi:hypothetical protein